MRSTGCRIVAGLRVQIAFAILYVTCSFAFAQGQPGPPRELLVPDNIKLSRFVDLVAEANQLQITYAPVDLETAVTLRVRGAVTPRESMDLLTQVLAARGLAIVRPAGSPVLTVVKIDQAAGTSAVGPAALGAGFVTEVIEPKHATAKAVIDAIKPLLSKPSGTAVQLGDSPLIAVSDFVGRLSDIETLLARIDVAGAVTTTDIPVRHLPAAQVVALVTQLEAKRELAGARKLAGDVVATPDGSAVVLISDPGSEQAWKDLIAQADQREGVATVTYTPRFFAAKDVSKLVESVANAPGGGAAGASDDRFRVVVDDLTSSLIVTATATQHDRIKALLERLDANDRGPTPFRSYPIRNRPVSEVLETLQQLIAAGILESDNGDAARAEVTAGASQSTARSPLLPQLAPGAKPSTSVVGPTTTGPRSSGPSPSNSASKPPLSLTADEATNTLIAIGEPRMLSQLEGLLAKLDVRQPQVMLEVMLVSLSDSDTLTLGTELERLGSLGNATVRLSSLFGLSTGPAAARSVGDAVGFTGAVLNPGEFSVIIRALETVNKGRAFSNPKLLVTNNEKAVFSSTIQQPVQSLTRTGSNDTTFSFGGTENAGTTISVKPQIAQGDHLVLTYSIKLSSFVGSSASPGLPPPKQENAVDSVATIPDGFTVVVGGLDLLNDSKGESRIPLIGQIPLIGELFKTHNNTEDHSKFFVFIKATVLRSTSFEDLKYISAVDTAKVGVDDGFPEVLPRVIR